MCTRVNPIGSSLVIFVVALGQAETAPADEASEPPADAASEPPAGAAPAPRADAAPEPADAASEPADAASEPPADETALSASTSRPPMSWDVLGGGTPDSGVVASARLGFSRLGEIRLEVAILDGLLVGAWAGFDYGFWTPALADDDLGLVFGATARYRILHDAAWSIGVSASPGGRARLGDNGGGELLIPLSARALYAVDPRILVGATIDLPFRFAFPSRGDDFFALPVTVGVAGEMHVFPPFAVTARLGVGPALDTRRVETAFRGEVGVAYRL
jgi:hypothetical protein